VRFARRFSESAESRFAFPNTASAGLARPHYRRQGIKNEKKRKKVLQKFARTEKVATFAPAKQRKPSVIEVLQKVLQKIFGVYKFS